MVLGVQNQLLKGDGAPVSFFGARPESGQLAGVSGLVKIYFAV
jgi:hypothetical protein